MKPGRRWPEPLTAPGETPSWPVLRPSSAAAVHAAAIAPAEAPPTLRTRMSRAISHTAKG